MKTLQINEKDARRIYPTASDEFRKILEDTFGKSFFSGDITDRIHSFEDCLAESGRPDVPAFADAPEDLRNFFKNIYRMVVISEAYNQGERLDIYDSSVKRHYQYFLCNNAPAGFAFYGSFYVLDFASAGSGSRLSFTKSEHSKDAGKKFIRIYQGALEG